MPDLRMLSLCLILSFTSAKMSAHPTLWIAPQPLSLRSDGTIVGERDYDDLASADPMWSVDKDGVKVFKLYVAYIRDSRDETLLRLFEWLRLHHIALALETPILTASVGCGNRERHTSWITDPVERLQHLGAQLEYLAIVGPVVDGYVRTRQQLCPRSMVEVAQDASASLSAVRSLFPGVHVGEIEPVGDSDRFPTAIEMKQWLATFEAVDGHRLEFLHSDVSWGSNWAPSLEATAAVMRESGVKVGVIYNSDSAELSNERYHSEALEHARAVEEAISPPPDQAVLQTWTRFPDALLPDTDPQSFSGTIRAYLRPETTLEVNAGYVSLVDQTSVAIPGKPISFERFTNANELVSQSITGTTPHGAASAIVGLRVHTECNMGENTAAQVRLASIRFTYSDQRSSVLSYHNKRRPAQTERYHIVSDAFKGLEGSSTTERNQKLLRNGETFSVTPDTDFELAFSWNVPDQSNGEGCIAVIFKDSSQQEISRLPIPFQSTLISIGTEVTDSTGRVAISRPLSDSAIKAVFKGDQSHQPATARLSQH